jgi:hypothetical protein
MYKKIPKCLNIKKKKENIKTTQVNHSEWMYATTQVNHSEWMYAITIFCSTLLVGMSRNV